MPRSEAIAAIAHGLHGQFKTRFETMIRGYRIPAYIVNGMGDRCEGPPTYGVIENKQFISIVYDPDKIRVFSHVRANILPGMTRMERPIIIRYSDPDLIDKVVNLIYDCYCEYVDKWKP